MTATANAASVWGPPREEDTLAAVKARQQAMWASGDFAVVGTTLQIVGETICEAVDLRAGERVLDVAAGNGNATLAAARRFARVTSTDYVPALLERGRRRAEADGLEVTFETADAEALPYAAGSFDVTISTFGVMFTPDHRRAAHELMRVIRPGGRIGLACWTPEGFLGGLFRTVAAHVAPIPGVASPLLWGKRDYVESLFERAASIATERRTFAFRYLSAEHFVEVFRRYYGPVHKAFASLDANGQAALERDLVALLRQSNAGGAGAGLVVPGEYLEIVVRR
jgi:ubiquinone/menaquinone biosynthesis C-methylase UbiE